MLIDKHEADNILKRVPGLVIKMSPELAAINTVLDDDELFCMIRDDLGRRYPKTMTAGRKSTPVEVILRMLTIKHLYDLSYEQTELQVADSLVLRQFCRVYFQSPPDHSTLCRWANQIRPNTLEAFNQRVMNLAIDSKLTRGRKLRMDGTAVETTIHHLTDSRQLADCVRVLGRTLTRAKSLLAARSELRKETFRNRHRSARRAARKIARLSRRRREQLKPHYQRLTQVTRATIRQAEQVLAEIEDQAVEQGQRLVETLQTFIPRAARSSTKPFAAFLLVRKCQQPRSWSASLNPIRTSSAAASPTRKPNSVTWSGSAKWKAASSLSTGYWKATRPTSLSGNPCLNIMCNNLVNHHGKPAPTAVSIPVIMKPLRPSWG
jgi:IS5 family transposase